MGDQRPYPQWPYLSECCKIHYFVGHIALHDLHSLASLVHFPNKRSTKHNVTAALHRNPKNDFDYTQSVMAYTRDAVHAGFDKVNYLHGWQVEQIALQLLFSGEAFICQLLELCELVDQAVDLRNIRRRS